MTEITQKNDWKLILEQLEQNTGTIIDLSREAMKVIFGDNWTRVWRGDVRKGRKSSDLMSAGVAFGTLEYLGQWSAKLVTMTRDALGIPRHGKGAEPDV